jgi:hypothetical protein
MKTCKTCGVTKPADGFYLRGNGGYPRGPCKECANKAAAAWNAANPERRRAADAKWRAANREKKQVAKAKWRAANREKKRAADAKWEAANRGKVNAAKRARRATPRGNLDRRMSGSIRQALRRAKKGGRRWQTLVGYTLAELMAHLEQRFLPGMGWHNMGEWHIDHRIPVSGFEYESPDDPQFRACWSLDNLQPRWGVENLSKSDSCRELAQLFHGAGPVICISPDLPESVYHGETLIEALSNARAAIAEARRYAG